MEILCVLSNILCPHLWQTPPSLLSLFRLHWVLGVSGIRCCLFPCIWPVSLCIMSSIFMHFVACIRISSPFKAGFCSFVHMCHSLFIRRVSVDGHLDCFLWTTVTNSAIETDDQESAWAFPTQLREAWSRLVGWKGDSVLNILRKTSHFPVAVTFTFPLTRHRCFHFCLH